MSRFRQTQSQPNFRQRLLIGTLIGLTALQPVMQAASSLPTGGTFAAGSGNIAASGNTLTINQSSLRGIIDWNTFSIGKGASVSFKNGSGATLNRVNGGPATSILGQLLATGNVYLINPEGILIGHGATIHTGGDFLASTLNLSNSAFLNGGPLTFTGSSPATVVNLGDLTSTGGSVYLIGHSVQNAGSINTPNGTTGLAAGSQVLVTDSSTNQKVAVQAPGGDVTNSGFIHAAQAELKSNGGNIYALAGNNGGQINATGTATQDGHVWLVATNGTTNVSGLISATNANGTGGSIETSGAHVVTKGAQLKTGKGGNWLLDPDDLTIDSSLAGTIETSLNGGTNVTEQTTDSGTGGSGDITVASNIAWTTGADLTLSAYRNIGINNGVTISNTGAGNLTLRADNASTGTGTITFTGTGKVDFSGSTGTVSLLYNPSSYATPTDYSSNVLTNGSWASPGDGSVNTQLTAYMLVNSVTELQNINTNSSGTYALGTNLDATSASSFTPITLLSGIFDGRGNTISNLSISYSGGSPAGLFSQSTGTIRNVGLMNETVADGASTGRVGGLVGVNNGQIYGSFVNGQIDSQAAGGLTGYNNGTITNSYAAGAVEGGQGNTGGLVYSNSGTINSSYSTAMASQGLVYEGAGVANNSYWDTGNSGTTSSAVGIGVTRATLQSGIPTGFSGNVWGGGGANAIYPYLLWQLPPGTTAVPVYGFTYLNQSQLSGFANTPVRGIANGVDFGQTVYTGADGYYYFLMNSANASPGSGLITYLPQNGYTMAFYNNAQSEISMPITYGYLSMLNTPSSFTAGVGNMKTAAGALIGNLPFTVGTGNILNLGSGTNLDVASAEGTSLDQALTLDSLVLEGYGSFTQTAALNATDLSLLGYDRYTLTNAGNSVGTLATATARNTVVTPQIVINSGPSSRAVHPLAQALTGIKVSTGSNLILGTTDAAAGIYSESTAIITTTGSLTIDSGITVEADASNAGPRLVRPNVPVSISGPALVLADGTAFINNSGSAALRTPRSYWQVWSQNPASDQRGGEAYNFKQYNAAYGVTTPDQSTGNGFFYTVAPTLTTTFASVTKQYDATTAAAIDTASYSSLTGAIDGDATTLSNPSASGTFSNKNAGTDKTVTVTGLTATATALAGAANVYGYTVNPAQNVTSTITQAPVVVVAFAANKVYDGTTTATGSATLSGIFEGDSVSLASGAAYSFDNPNAGNSKPVTVSGLALTGTDAGNYSVSVEDTTTANITPATLTYTADPVSRPPGANNPSFAGSVTGFVDGQTLATATTGTALFTSSANSGSVVGSYAIDGSGLTANHGNYDFVQAPVNAAALTVIAAGVTPPPPTPTPAPTPTPTPNVTVLTFVINNATALQNSTPTFTADYSGPAINGLNIPTLVAGLIYQITPSVSGPGTYTITATGTAPSGYIFNIVPATFTVIGSTPQTIPSQALVTSPILPVLLPPTGVVANNLLQPVNTLGFFQISVGTTANGFGTSFAGFTTQQTPLAQSSFFGGSTGQNNTYFAGAKP